jgi:hypothetical protein
MRFAIERSTSWLLLLAPVVSVAQVGLLNKSLTEPELDILYRGIENRIEVTGVDDMETLELRTLGGQTHRYSEATSAFLVKARSTSMDTLELFHAGVLMLSKTYETRIIEDPVARIGDITDTVATVEEILRDPTLHVFIPGSHYAHCFQVAYFELALFGIAGDTLHHCERSWGDTLGKPHIRQIRKLRKGERISVVITRGCPSCTLVRLRPLTITIE